MWLEHVAGKAFIALKGLRFSNGVLTIRTPASSECPARSNPIPWVRFRKGGKWILTA